MCPKIPGLTIAWLGEVQQETRHLLLRGEFCLSQLKKPYKKNKQKHPRSCSLTTVHNVILEDLVSPSEITGKRICKKLNGSWLIWIKHSRTMWNTKFKHFLVSVRSSWVNSPMVQWLGIRLPMHGTWVRSLVWEDSTCHGATKPTHHNYWACALKPMNHNYWSSHTTEPENHKYWVHTL